MSQATLWVNLTLFFCLYIGDDHVPMDIEISMADFMIDHRRMIFTQETNSLMSLHIMAGRGVIQIAPVQGDHCHWEKYIKMYQCHTKPEVHALSQCPTIWSGFFNRLLPTCITIEEVIFHDTLRGDEVSILTHTYPNKPLRKIKLVICNHQVDNSFHRWPNVWSDELQAQNRVLFFSKCFRAGFYTFSQLKFEVIMGIKSM